MRLKTIILLLVFLVNLTLVSCESESDSLKPEKLGYSPAGERKSNDDIMDMGPVKGGTLRLFSTYPDTFNPLLTNNAYVSEFLALIYEGLVYLDGKQQPQPQLSDKWSVSGDGLVWNFHIRDGIRWSDGKPFTARDVEFTFRFLLDANTDSPYKKQLQNVAAYSAVDTSNFRIILVKPDFFTAELMTFPVIPSHLSEELKKNVDFKPVGTGPFRLDKYEEKKAVILEKNETWWYIDAREDKKEEIMLIDKISVKLYETAEKSINAFQVYDIDAAGIGMDDIVKYTSRTDMMIKSYTSREFEFLAFNLQNPVFADISVRKAVEAAIDRQIIQKEILNGNATIADIPIHPDSWLLDGSKNKADGQVAAVLPRDILLEGGWKERESGFYKTLAGVVRKLEIELLVNNNNSRRIMVAERLCRQLQDAGITAVVTRLPWSSLNNLLDAGKFDMVLTGLRITRAPDISFLYSNSYLPARFPVQSYIARNISGYSSMEANNLIEAMYRENDNDKRKKLLSSFTDIVKRDLPYIGLFFLDNAVIYRKSVRGSIEPNVWNKYNDITGWYMPKTQ